MKLSTYMSDNKITAAKMAKLVGESSPFTVGKWVRGERMPRPDQLRRIFEATNGAVTPNDFVLPEKAA